MVSVVAPCFGDVLISLSAVYLRQLVHWCGRREFLLRLPDVQWRKVNYSGGDARVQEGLGRVREPEDWLSGTAQLCSLLRGTSFFVLT